MHNKTRDGVTVTAKVGLPSIAYITLWFPLASETFIFREILGLQTLDASIRVYTMYGKKLKNCSGEMRNFAVPTLRMGIQATWRILTAFVRAVRKTPSKVLWLLRKCVARKMRDLETFGENLWCFFAGFLLAEYCKKDNISLMHSAWGNGPATAAWVAFHLTGIPFAFTGRAGDIYPQDGFLREKSRDALFIRANNLANVRYLQEFCPAEQRDKVRLVYNGLTFPTLQDRPKPQNVPFRLLSIGRFVRTKGFPELLTALARLKREGVPARLTLAGDGQWRGRLLRLIQRLRLDDCVDLPGFIPHDQAQAIMQSHDVLVVPSVVHTNGDRDGIPNVIMEGLSCGMPVVATDVCGIAEVIHNGYSGLLVPQRDPAALARAVRCMLENRDEALRMAKTGKALVERMFDNTANIRALYALYTQYFPR
ncbi:MAG: putative colanic acid biosynthesis glycosyltransferase WcaL [Candidatus Desulfovibrio kirbyi]|jgi:glycosyltransferase involved in cell wall biosynthesis|uniref:Putative colanic acid biosynthesis glycosyltransferase WcaL n=1 Tax=Candidatus Desulfovibrio kirbyi TaxID=2696086 RepID=A0A6L2R610_9BACT|nr:MAG: putative colanic acid biosynthesis glycosyltransferase WcaL [Candidatus Desulfovibrio kirbyi]